MVKRVAYVTNIPVPYRNPVLEILSQDSDIDLTVIYFSVREPDRNWHLDNGSYKQVYLKQRFLAFRDRYIHFNFDIFLKLKALKPEVIVTTGFNPTHLMAFAYAHLIGAAHVTMTDGTLISERTLSVVHRFVRRIIYKRSLAFVGPSNGTFALYKSYGVNRAAMFKSHLCANSDAFYLSPEPLVKQFDLLFSARLVSLKNPIFALEVAAEVGRRLRRVVSLAIMGTGPLEAEVRLRANELSQFVKTDMLGFVEQALLPKHYKNAKLFLFPTSFDTWGVVANEACAAGLPVITTTAAGVAGEIIRDGVNGFVIELDIDKWADACVSLLTDQAMYQLFSKRSLELVHPYNYVNAAAGLKAAIESVAFDGTKNVTPISHTACKPKRVVVIQRRMTRYRVPFFDALRRQMETAGLELVVVYGDPTKIEAKKDDGDVLPWGMHVGCTYWLGGRICWQNASALTKSADLVVLASENKLLWNLTEQYFHFEHRVALWGHGANLQGDPGSIRERFKRFVMQKADWWFGYTELSTPLVTRTGFPEERVTILDNAVDIMELSKLRNSFSIQEQKEILKSLGLIGESTCVFIGSLYKEKRVDFLIKAAIAIRRLVPNFELIVIGAGPNQHLITTAASQLKWIKYLGVKNGREKALLISISKLILNPGLVGLGILDSFALGVPMVTTEFGGHHSPEISYLKTGVNGLITIDSLDAFVASVCNALGDPTQIDLLRAECIKSSLNFSIDKMASNFVKGVVACLAAPILRARV